ncbi:hypothetical protein MRB53_016862 [Persea americana]|uniref:Uncharacterized protein n=1 Tax=Persea americana TaxID=3435 RepID=A0ACC2M3X7_PERAE|nr:hypothetical protein MRB53_016862 [Persea americana]
MKFLKIQRDRADYEGIQSFFKGDYHSNSKRDNRTSRSTERDCSILSLNRRDPCSDRLGKRKAEEESEWKSQGRKNGKELEQILMREEAKAAASVGPLKGLTGCILSDGSPNASPYVRGVELDRQPDPDLQGSGPPC